MKKLTISIILLFFLATVAIAKVNINTASVNELQTIKGIGQVKAEAIVKDRQKNGKYRSIEDLSRVKGIGPRTVKKIKEEITVGK